ncbi:zinc metalloprotease [Leeuwenhoekiella nanhaiensis]|uniref:Zinc metalloprotease n=1 Tax=Leeuwenhoekiella nanhaiensis TaxID=1655491 RepID=A0A2G1VSE1_9FLAO|nr:zinc metalloprotease [Leeuwenhoekiella nanhaiensis]PHQ29675.1 zinc metalloprotease [Leeuwenhoekiella nanhaiensis]
MKKAALAFGIACVTMLSCADNVEESNEVQKSVDQEVAVDMSDFYLYTDDFTNGKSSVGKSPKVCFTMANLNRQLDEDDKLYDKMYNIEKNSRAFIAAKSSNGKGKPGSGGGDGGGTTPPVDDGLGVINIPVVVHVIYSNSQENISDAQIASQIAVLNDDFNATNSDVSQVPSEFAGVVADSDINFTLAQTIRVSSTRTSWGTRDEMKFSSNGGSDVVSPSTHLNIWVCNIGGGILGYAQFPGGPASTDGVVVGPQYFGSTGFVAAPFDEGRTTTHEVGHYLNLRHIWGDGRCRQDDFVADTPSSDGPNYGCPSYPTVNCRSNDMTMNYMDYVNDACMYMFSEGQKVRMRALFASGGPRAAFLN